MKTATMLLASCALLISLPASAQQPATAKPPPPAKAEAPQQIDVTVIVPAGCGSGIHVAPDPIVTKPGAVITWNIRSSGEWKFSTDGIVIHNGSAAFRTEGRAGTTSYTSTRIASEKGMFKYDITLERKGEAGKCKHDPTVINQ